jgi:hypothetical protein
MHCTLLLLRCGCCWLQAEETLVTIIPRFRHPVLHFISVRNEQPRTQTHVCVWYRRMFTKDDDCLLVALMRRETLDRSSRKHPRKCRCGWRSPCGNETNAKWSRQSGWSLVRCRCELCGLAIFFAVAHELLLPAETLQALLEAERVNNTFQELPFHWLEIATLFMKQLSAVFDAATVPVRAHELANTSINVGLLCSAADDVADLDRIKVVINVRACLWAVVNRKQKWDSSP